MLITIISIIEWAKLIIGLGLALMGFVMFIRPFIGSLRQNKGNLNTSLTYVAMFGIALITMITGFYIAGW